MLKETETEETKPFCHIFIIRGISIGVREPGPWLRLRPQQTKMELTKVTSWPLLVTVKPPTLMPCQYLWYTTYITSSGEK